MPESSESKDYIEVKNSKGEVVRFSKDRVEKLPSGMADGAILEEPPKSGMVSKKPALDQLDKNYDQDRSDNL